MPKIKRTRRSKSKTGYFGVRKRPSGKYEATLQMGKCETNQMKRRTISLGYYDTAKEAAKRYDIEAIKSRRPFSALNYPKKAPVGYTPLQQPLQSRNTVGYRGVYKTASLKYQVRITIDSQNISIGTYETAKEAAVAWDRAVLKSNRSTSLLNFPDMVHNLDVEPKRTKYKRSASGYRGVYKLPSGKFVARINTNYQYTEIGKFDTPMEAALAYDQAAIKKGNNKKSTFLNFPMEEKKQIKQEKQTEQKKTKKKDLLAIQEYKEMLQIWKDME